MAPLIANTTAAAVIGHDIGVSQRIIGKEGIRGDVARLLDMVLLAAIFSTGTEVAKTIGGPEKASAIGGGDDAFALGLMAAKGIKNALSKVSPRQVLGRLASGQPGGFENT